MLYRFETGKKNDPTQQDDQEKAVVPAKYSQLVHHLFPLSIFCFPLINQVFGWWYINFHDTEIGFGDGEATIEDLARPTVLRGDLMKSDGSAVLSTTFPMG
jgi:hypothetical protein